MSQRYVEIALQNLRTEAPHQLDHVAQDTRGYTVKELHPAFHTSYDWHSCVHMHWLLVRLLPEATDPAAVRAALDRNLTAEALAAEAAYLRSSPSFERPYGWAWALVLAAAVAKSPDEAAPKWSAAMTPLVDTIVGLSVEWLEGAARPVRSGVHSNSAFALALLLEAAESLGQDRLAQAVRDKARAWFEADTDYPIAWEPSGEDFVSPALCEADLMRRVLTEHEFAAWLPAFLPDLSVLKPVQVRYPIDGRQGHLQGLNLTRAWQLAALTDDDRQVTAHLDAALPSVTSGDFNHDHWLATFAYLAQGGALIE
ncbi:DUF2891 family protein [Kribbella sp. NPDC051770]|uniref:DUF2891 family protein n=1 Tax=Kribbella sp. NPDC051770 TaxID=3155413 RepID=UPI003430933F